ncbi:hypothetical protein Sa4125_27900 [Aureimonas sp. SA4125]|uniref:MarR family winged helix-turn-helix transcriptional regulator n=1 Tax=Aureimonas sp. SA4125 TaxID=2826993 RepID=UPI001CC44A40|nr:MarR family transcriptional regulator [Aureimonas sp. SA4125]BDA85248.1 hypothetical protein Sa4125_27900 [Aureimonas sp. SA4125]
MYIETTKAHANSPKPGDASAVAELAGPLIPTLLSLSKTTRALMGIKLAEVGLHQGQDELLMSLEHGSPMSVSALSEKLCVRPSTVSKMLDRLCAKGLVDRIPSPRDARLTLVRLTPSGDAMKTEVRQLWGMIEADLSSRMAQDGIDTMMGALGTIDGIIGARLMRLR